MFLPRGRQSKWRYSNAYIAFWFGRRFQVDLTKPALLPLYSIISTQATLTETKRERQAVKNLQATQRDRKRERERERETVSWGEGIWEIKHGREFYQIKEQIMWFLGMSQYEPCRL